MPPRTQHIPARRRCLCAGLLLTLAPLCRAQVSSDVQLPALPTTWSSGTNTVAAVNTITAAGPANGTLLINGTAQTTFMAGARISLEPGFHAIATSGATFHAFLAPTIPVTFRSNPSGRTLLVDGVAYTAPQTLQLFAGAHTVDASPAQTAPAGARYTFQSWTDAGAAAHTIAVSAATDLTANFATQYYLTTSAGTGGSITPPSGWYDAGNSVSVTATANPGYQFSGFTGTVASSTNPLSLTMNGPSTLTASFTLAVPAVSLTPSSGAGASQILTAAYIDPVAYGQITEALLLVNSSAATASACYVKWTPGNHFYLRNETDTAWLDGTTASVHNTRCRLDAPANGAQGTGQTLTVNFGLTFFSAFLGPKNLYLTTTTVLGTTPWQPAGAWTVDMTSGDYTVTALTPTATTSQNGNVQYQYKITAIGGIDGSLVHVASVSIPGTPYSCLGSWNQVSAWDPATRSGTVTLGIEIVNSPCSGGFVFAYTPQVTWSTVAGNVPPKTTTDTTLNCCITTPTVSITVTPATTTLRAGQSATFTATVRGNANTSVVWNQPTIGTLILNNSDGVYTAPANISTTQYVVLTVQSVQDPSKTASATVTLQPAAPTNVPTYTISGIVTQADGTPFGPISINVTGDQAQTVATNTGGQYSVPPLPAGHYVVKPASDYGAVTSITYNLFEPKSGTHIMRPFRFNVAAPVEDPNEGGGSRNLIHVSAIGSTRLDTWWTDVIINSKDIQSPGCWAKSGASAAYSARDQAIVASYTPDSSGPHFVITFTPNGVIGFRDVVCRYGGKDIIGADIISFEPQGVVVTSNGQTVAQGKCADLSFAQALYIDSTPTMPQVTARIVMSNNSAPTGTTIWKLSGSYPPESTFWGPVGPQPETDATQPWNVPWGGLFGGGDVAIGWTYGGVQMPPINFCILGTNPAQTAIASLLTPPSSPFWFANNIAIHETNQSQFCDRSPQSSRTTASEFCAKGGDPVVGMSIWGDPHGYGIMQLDPPPAVTSAWNWRQNINDGISRLQNLAGSVTGTTGGAAYQFWNRQVKQWNDENVQRQASGLPTVPPPEQVDPGPNSSPNCRFIASLNPTTGISTPNTGLGNTYWYGDAILMKQNAGTVDKCGVNANYVSYSPGIPPTAGSWSFHKGTIPNRDVVYEFCTCTTFDSCVRLAKPTCP